MELTRESIMSMEASKLLDLWIAGKVMGWKQGVDFDIDDYREGVARYEPSGMDVRTFSPSTDISAAWEVVEKMRRPFSNRFKFSKEMQDQMNKELIEDEADIRIAPTEIVFHMTPLNICRAALLTTLTE